MSKAITEEQRREWASVHEQVLALAEFFDSRSKDPQLALAIQAVAEPTQPYRARLAALREALVDMLEASSDLRSDDLRELDRHLRARLGVALDDLQAKRLAHGLRPRG